MLQSQEFKYRVVESSSNAVIILPLPAQPFTEQARSDIIKIMEQHGHLARIKKTGVSVISSNDLDREMIEDILPKPKTKAQIKQEKQEVDREIAKKSRHEYQQKTFSENEGAVNWFNEVFSTSRLGDYNKAALISFITGNAKTFDGLLNSSLYDDILKLGATKNCPETGDPLIDLDKIKAAYVDSLQG